MENHQEHPYESNIWDHSSTFITAIAWCMFPILALLILSISLSILLPDNLLKNPHSLWIGQSLPLLISFVILPWLYLAKIEKMKVLQTLVTSGYQVRLDSLLAFVFLAMLLFLFMNGKLISHYIAISHFAVVALSEEFLTRGILIKKLSKTFTPALCLIISSICFAFIFHSNVSMLMNLLIRLPLGLLLGFLYLKAKNLRTPILVHWVYNVLVFTYAA